MSWRVFAAAVTGKSHLDRGVPCQDAFAYDVQGDTLIAAVCDGAGSASHSDIGARFVADGVVSALAARIQDAGEESAWTDAVDFEVSLSTILANVRQALAGLAQDHNVGLGACACTLVGAVAGREHGWLFHVGDGVAVATLHDIDAPVLSVPENGEYANETYFVTGPDWARHLRRTPFQGRVRRLVLMSDGVAPFAMDRCGSDLFAPFIDPVERYLLGVDEAAGSAALAATLGNERTHSITGDDKSLLIAFCE